MRGTGGTVRLMFNLKSQVGSGETALVFREMGHLRHSEGKKMDQQGQWLTKTPSDDVESDLKGSPMSTKKDGSQRVLLYKSKKRC